MSDHERRCRYRSSNVDLAARAFGFTVAYDRSALFPQRNSD
jgi:hypothetical protein